MMKKANYSEFSAHQPLHVDFVAKLKGLSAPVSADSIHFAKDWWAATRDNLFMSLWNIIFIRCQIRKPLRFHCKEILSASICDARYVSILNGMSLYEQQSDLKCLYCLQCLDATLLAI